MGWNGAMDKKIIDAMKNKIKEFENLIQKCIDPKQLLLLNEMKGVFSKTLKEWEERYESEQGFTIICNKCGVINEVNFTCNEGEYQSEVYIECLNCKNEKQHWC